MDLLPWMIGKTSKGQLIVTTSNERWLEAKPDADRNRNHLMAVTWRGIRRRQFKVDLVLSQAM